VFKEALQGSENYKERYEEEWVHRTRQKLRRVLIWRRYAEDIEGREIRRQDDMRVKIPKRLFTMKVLEDFYLRRIRKALKVWRNSTKKLKIQSKLKKKLVS